MKPSLFPSGKKCITQPSQDATAVNSQNPEQVKESNQMHGCPACGTMSFQSVGMKR